MQDKTSNTNSDWFLPDIVQERVTLAKFSKLNPNSNFRIPELLEIASTERAAIAKFLNPKR